MIPRPVLLSALCLPCLAQAHLPEPAERYRADQIIVRYVDGVSVTRTQSLLKAGYTPVRELLGGRGAVLQLASPLSMDAALRSLNGDPDVVYAEPNYRRQAAAVSPDDEFFALQWGLLNTGQANEVEDGPAGVVGADLNLPEAWDADGDGVADRIGDGTAIVALIDDAVDTRHPDLMANLLPGYDVADNDADVNPEWHGQSHGTLVAGTIAAVSDNGIGVASPAWNLKLLPIAFEFDVSTFVAALEYAAAQGATIVNASFSGSDYSQAERDAIEAYGEAGGLLVVAAGNRDANLDASRLSYPANYPLPNIVSVAAINRQDQIASFSTYGATSVDVAAPGLQIVSTLPGGGYASDPSASGSSLAAGYVSSLAALVQMQSGDSDPLATRARLIESGRAADGVGARTAGGVIDADVLLDMTPRPSIVIDEVRIDPDGDGALEAGESTTIEWVLRNLWQLSGPLTVEVTVDDDIVSVDDTPILVGVLAQGQTATVSVPVSVAVPVMPFNDHRRLRFTLTVGDGLYRAERAFVAELAPLSAGLDSDSIIGTDRYDEFQTFSFRLDNLPEGHDALTILIEGGNDLDLLVGYGEPPGYSIELGGYAFAYDVPDAQVGGSPHGEEFVEISDPQPGTYFATVVNWDRAGNAPFRIRAWTSEGGISPYANSSEAYYASFHDDDGGATAPATLLALFGLWGLRRLRLRRHRA